MKHRATLKLVAGLFICLICVGGFFWRHSVVSKRNLHKQCLQLINNAEQAFRGKNFTHAEQCCVQAMKTVLKFGPKDTCLLKSQQLLARIYVEDAKPEMAEKVFNDAVVYCEQTLGTNSLEIIKPLDNLANFYHHMLWLDKEAITCERILKIIENSSISDERIIADRSYNLALVYQKLGKYDKAEMLYKKAFTIAEKKNYDVFMLLLKMAEFYQQWGKCQLAEQLAKRALDMQESTVGADANIQLDFGDFFYSLAEIYLACGKSSNAEPLYTKSLFFIEKTNNKESIDLVKPIIGLAASLRYQGKFEKAEVQYKKAMNIVEGNLGSTATELDTITKAYIALLYEMNNPKEVKKLLQDQKWKALMHNSALQLKANNLSEAKHLCEEALIMARLFDSHDFRLSQCQTFMGEIYRAEMKYDLSEKYFKDAILSCEHGVGANHQDLITTLESLANFYYYTRINLSQVELIYLRILRILQNGVNPDISAIARRTRNLAEVYVFDKQYEKAESLFKQSLAMIEKKAGLNSCESVEFMQSLYNFYRGLGKLESAELLAKRALEIREKAGKSDIDSQLDIANCLDDLATIYVSMKKPDKAIPLYQRAMVIFEQANGTEGCDLISHLISLADALRATGKFNKSEVAYNRAISISKKCAGSSTEEFAKLLEKYAALLKNMQKPEEAVNLLALVDSIRKNIIPR